MQNSVVRYLEKTAESPDDGCAADYGGCLKSRALLKKLVTDHEKTV